MFDRTRNRRGCAASLCLDCGVDECRCKAGDLEISERGMRFKSPWKFSPGTQIAVVLVCESGEGGRARVPIDGLVVECEKIAPHRFDVTLLFLDLPEDSPLAMREISDPPG